jgi:hypothetical protein
MANVIYPKAKEQFLQAGINMASGNIKAVLVDLADYTYDAAHNALDDVPAGARIDTTGNLGSKTFTNGLFDCANDVFAAATGDQAEAVIFYLDTGVESTSLLIAFFDTSITGAPITPNGGDINLNMDGSGIFQL